MDNYMPKLIRIMPDYGSEYGFDEDGGVIRLTLIFEAHPNINRITEIERELLWLADWIEYCEYIGKKVPWEKIDAKGVKLAQEMAIVLGDIGIPIVYQFRGNTPSQVSISSIGELIKNPNDHSCSAR